MMEETEEGMPEETAELLVSLDQYLAAGVHIGAKQKTGDMVPFIYRVRADGLRVLNINKADERLRFAASFLARFEPESIVVVAEREYGHQAIQKFAEVIGANARPGRFVPGTLTNPSLDEFMEPEVMVATDPFADKQAIKEANHAGMPVIAFCDTNNTIRHVDLMIPANNKGRKSIALLFWILAREILLARGVLSDPEKFTLTLEDFGAKE